MNFITPIGNTTSDTIYNLHYIYGIYAEDTRIVFRFKDGSTSSWPYHNDVDCKNSYKELMQILAPCKPKEVLPL